MFQIYWLLLAFLLVAYIGEVCGGFKFIASPGNIFSKGGRRENFVFTSGYLGLKFCYVSWFRDHFSSDGHFAHRSQPTLNLFWTNRTEHTWRHTVHCTLGTWGGGCCTSSLIQNILHSDMAMSLVADAVELPWESHKTGTFNLPSRMSNLPW